MALVVPSTLDNGGGDFGTDAELRTLLQTQSTPAPYNEELVAAAEEESRLRAEQAYNDAVVPGYPTTEGGTGWYDDATPNNYGGPVISGDRVPPPNVAGTVNTNSRATIKPQANVLDRFASYTYRASVYLMTPEQVERYVNTQRRSVSNYQLLFQSGGAPTNVSGFTGALDEAGAGRGGRNFAFNDPRRVDRVEGVTADPGRNPAFDVDFYIDSITLKSNLLGKATGAAHSQAELKFTVVEPYGITLIDRIYRAVQDLAPKDAGGAVNYQTAHFLMVIRFYGYDINGNLQVVGAADPRTGLTDPNAVVEKFIPFQIATINWSVKSSTTTYDFTCTPLGNWIAAGSRRGTIPFDMSLTASSVKDILTGSQKSTGAPGDNPGASTTTLTTTSLPFANTAAGAAVGARLNVGRNARTQTARETQASVRAVDNAIDAAITAPAKANAARQANQPMASGLMSALNDFIANLTTGSNPIYEVPDIYEVVFAPGAEAIRDATIILPGTKKEAKQSASTLQPQQDAKAIDPKTQAKNTTAKAITIVAGQPIVQVLDEIIRNSSYIYNQQLTVVDAESDEEIPNPRALGKPVNWFQISFKAVPLQYDKLRNDWAYKITYYISTYTIDNYDSKYFPIGTFRGVHKSYPYWFTGNNTAVIDYSETLNTAYNQLVSGSNPKDSQMETLRRNQANSMEEMTIYTYGPRSGQSGQQTSGKGTEPMANMADSLYTPDPKVNCKLRIIGDPGWIQQGSLSGGLTETSFTERSFLPDGTINYDAEQVMFEVSWQRPDDYDIYTGLAKTGANSKYPRKSRVYNAISVLNEFRQGKFEQTVEGTLFNIPKPDGSNKAPTAPIARTSAQQVTTAEQAETARNAAPGVTTQVGGTLVTNTAGGAAIVYRTGRRSGTPHVVPTVENGLLSAPSAPNQTASTPSGQAQTGTLPNDTAAPQSPPQPPTSAGQNVSWFDRALNRLAGQTVPSANLTGANRLANNQSTQPQTPQTVSKEY